MLNRIRREPALVSGLVQAVLALLIAFGLSLSNEQTAAILAVTAGGLALFVRAKVSPTPPPANGEDGAVDIGLLLLIAILVLVVLIYVR